MRTAKYSIIAVLILLTMTSLMGCRYEQWQHDLTVGQSTALDVQEAFKTPVEPEDRYAYALAKDELNKNTELMMVNLDEDGIVTAKYYWHWARTSILFFGRTDSWKIALETQVAPSELQQYSAAPGPREEAIVQYFRHILFDTSRHFDQIEEVFNGSSSMRRILEMAAIQYSSRGDKRTLLSKDGFTFDAGTFGSDCSMVLEPVDESQGLYMLSLKGQRTYTFFTGW